MNPPPTSVSEDQVDEVEDDDESPSNQNNMAAHGAKPQSASSLNDQFGLYPSPNPSLANLNLPPIIMQTLEMAAAAPSPPFPLLSSVNPLNFNPMQIPPSIESNAANKPAMNDPVDEQSEKHPDKSSESTEPPNSMLNTPDSVPTIESPTAANPMTKPASTVKQHKPLFIFGNPLYQSAYYNQYNTFVPYYLYPYHQNKKLHTRKNLSKSKRIRSSPKTPPPKTIIINIS